MSAFDNRVHPTNIPDTPLAFPRVRIDLKINRKFKNRNPEKSPRHNSFLFPAILLTIIFSKRKTKP